MKRHDYASAADYRAMQSLTQRTWTASARWHVGDLAWDRYHGPSAGTGNWRTVLWTEGDQCTAWGWTELPGELHLVVDPSRAELVAEVLDWFDEVASGPSRDCTVLETEVHLVDGLLAAGYLPATDQPFFRYHSMTLDGLGDPVLPEGFRVRHVVPGEAAVRAAVHRAGWSGFGSRLSAASYAAVMAAWPYRHDLDCVVESPEGELVASALGWLDDLHRSGLLEPVGCAPAYRRMGLARAVNLACLHAMRGAGARTGHVNPRGDDGYPAPGKLYRSIGFEPGPRTVTYTRGRLVP